MPSDAFDLGKIDPAMADKPANTENARRNQAGDCRVFFFDAYHEAFGPDAMECIVDGWHLNDAGFLRFSKAVLPHIRRALGENRSLPELFNVPG